ncbi:MAG: hydroxylase [Acidobacteria bacterium]|nr:MAG: hydroxylase [Acidobacteriota bacterium]
MESGKWKVASLSGYIQRFQGGRVATTSIVGNIRHLVPTIRARRNDIEQARRLPADVAAALRQTGIFSLGVPRAIGGEEASPIELMQAIETVAAADGSAGWCAMIGLSGNLSAGYMNERGAKETWSDPAAPTAGIAAPAGTAVRVDGGVRVGGRWSFASGITHCDWVWAGCMVMDNGKPHMTPMGPEIVHVSMPVKEVQIHDTWHVSGLCGTGSNDFSATDIFIPNHRIFALLDPSGHRSEPLYRMPPLSLFVFQVGSVSLGIARAALDDLTQMAQSKMPTMYTTPLADRPVAQIQLARAEAALGGARAFLYSTAEEMWNTVTAGKPVSSRQLALARVAASHAVETGASVTRTANTLAGGSAIYTKSPMQRYARDAEAVTHHFTAAPHVWEEAGRVLLGRQPNVPVF